MINIKHVTQDIIDMIPRLAGEGIAVDVGCGDSKHREFIQGFGYVFVGIDLCGDVTIAGDAHKIPIKSNSVDLVFTLTAIEHFSNPFIAMSEMYRILKPGGLIVGSVAFIQPFHDKSYYHCSHFGI